MELNLHLIADPHNERGLGKWFASTRTDVKELRKDCLVKIEVPEGSWLEVWSDVTVAPASVTREHNDVFVTVTQTARRGKTKTTLLHVTDFHFCIDRATGTVLGLEEFGDITTPVGIELDIGSACDVEGVTTPDIIVVTGDLTDHGTDAEYELVKRWLTRTGTFVFLVPGNHDHWGDFYKEARTPNDMAAAVNPGRFETHVGPRWGARCLGDGLLIGLDWLSWRLGQDKDEQLAWLRALARAFSRRMSVVLAIHDELADYDWELLCSALQPHFVRVVLSGHWHISRVQDRRGYVGFSTGSCAFGGLHLGPPEARVLTLSKDLEINDSTTVIGTPASWRAEGKLQKEELPLPTGQQIWTRDFSCRFHRSNALISENEMLVGGAFDNRPGGTLIWLKTTTGVVCRQINLKHGPVGPLTMGFIGDSPICVFTAVDGTVAAINWSGDLLWELERSDAALRYSLNGPLVAGSFVLSGDCRGIDCQRLSDGAIVWSSGPFGTPENLLSYGSAISVNDHIVIPLGGPGIGLVCFRADTGEVIWRELGQRGIPASGIRVDGSRGYLVRSTGTVDCFEIETGRLIWCQHLCSSLGGPMPIICGEKLIAVTSDGYGGVFDKKSGTCDRMFKVTSPAVRVGAYRNVSTFVTGLDLLADSIWISCADGSIHSAVMDEEIGSFMPIIQRNVLTTSSAQFLNLDSAIVLGFEGRLELVEIPGSLQPSRLETQS